MARQSQARYLQSKTTRKQSTEMAQSSESIRARPAPNRVTKPSLEWTFHQSVEQSQKTPLDQSISDASDQPLERRSTDKLSEDLLRAATASKPITLTQPTPSNSALVSHSGQQHHLQDQQQQQRENGHSDSNSESDSRSRAESTTTTISAVEISLEKNERPPRQSLLDLTSARQLRTRLDQVSPEVAEVELSRLQHSSGQSLLNYLQNPGDGVTPIQAAAELLTELADDTERNGLTTVFIWRYMELNSDPKAFIKRLTSCDGIGENLVCGSATQANKVRYVSVITETWGPLWFGSIPKDDLPEKVNSPFGLSRRVLQQMIVTCKHTQGISLDRAILLYSQAKQSRLDGTLKKAGHRGRMPLDKHLIEADIVRVNEQIKRGDETSTFQVVELSLPEVKKDRHKLDQLTSLRAIAPKRKEPPVEATPEAYRPQKRISTDGKTEMVRVRNYLIRQPVSINVDDNSEAPSQSQVDNASQGAQQASLFVSSDSDSEANGTVDIVPNGTGHTSSCEAKVLLGKIGSQMEWSQDTHGCCQTCRQAIAKVRYAIARATATIEAAHR
jgi:hypothetical protein